MLTPQAVAALLALRPLEARRLELMQARLDRRRARQQQRQRIDFLPAEGTLAAGLAGADAVTVADARAGQFTGSEIPPDLQRQWVQGTGPAAKPNVPVEKSIRNVAYALLSGGRRLDVRRRGRARPGVDDVARQPAQPEAGHRPRPALPDGGRAGRRRDERPGRRLLRPDDLETGAGSGLHDAHLRARAAPRRPARRVADGGGAASRPRSSMPCSRRQQPAGAARRRRLGRPVSPQDPDAKKRLLEHHPDRPGGALAIPHGTIKAYVLVEQVERPSS